MVPILKQKVNTKAHDLTGDPNVDALNALYDTDTNGIGAGGSSGGSSNEEWRRVEVTASATGSQSSYVLPIIPTNGNCILVFVNGIGTIKFTYSVSTNMINFTDGDVPAGYNITAFILEKP